MGRVSGTTSKRGHSARGLVPDSAVASAVALLLVAVLFVLLRLALAGSGSIGSFVDAGSDFARPPLPGVPIESGPGYDGQFAYRLAVDPTELDEVPQPDVRVAVSNDDPADNIVLDTPLRLERILYPVLAWTVSAGQDSLVPPALVVVNLLALAALGYLGGRFAQLGGRHAAWGLLLAGYWGYLFSLGRDLHEIVTGVFVLAGLLAYRKRRPAATAGLLSLAVLARETALLVVVAIAAVRILDIARRRERPRALDAGWLVPAVMFVSWQAACYAAIGEAPALAGGPAQVGPPVVSFVEAIGNTVGDLTGDDRAAAALLLLQLAALVVVVALAGLRVRDASIPREERLAWLLALLLTLSLSRHYWTGPADLRALSDLYLLSAVLLLARPVRDTPRPLRERLPDARVLAYAAVPSAVAFAATFLTRVVKL